MIVPRELELKNYCQHRKLTYTFHAGIIGISGRNGSGKSNFLSALFFALTGKPMDGTKQDLLTSGASSGHVSLRFLCDGAEYKITRAVHSSTASLHVTHPDGTIAEEKGIEKVDRRMTELLGMSFDMLQALCFVPQDGLLSVVAAEHSRRMSFMQRLSGTLEAETLRTLLQTQLNNCPMVVDRSSELAGTLARVEQSRRDLAGIRNRILTEQAGLNVIMADENRIKHWHRVSLARTSEAITAEHVALTQEIRRQQERMTVLQTEKERLEALAPVVISEEDRKAYAEQQTRKALTAEIAKLRLDLTAIPVKGCPTAPDRTQLTQAEKTYSDNLPAYTLYKSGTCPTCKRDLAVLDKADWMAKFEYLAGVLPELRKGYDEAHRQYIQAMTEHGATTKKVEMLTSRLTVCEQELAGLKRPAIDEESWKIRLRAAELCEANQLKLRAVLSEIASLTRSLAELNRRLSDATGGESYTAAEKAEAQAGLQEITRRQEAIKKLEISEAETAARIGADDQVVTMLRDSEKQRMAAMHVTGVLTRARDLLHRDALPKLVMTKMLAGINAYMNFHLSKFEAPFTATLTDGFDFEATFPGDGHKTMQSRRLSGGQKVLLAVAFRFALSELFGKSVPLLVLDEPTTWLDQQNVQKLADVLEISRRMAEKNMFIMIATHEPELARSMTDRFSLDEASAA